MNVSLRPVALLPGPPERRRVGRYGDLDDQRLTKTGVLLSVAVFGIGAGAELLAAGMHWSLPGWEHVLFTDMEIVGTLGTPLVPFAFGVVLALTG